MQSNTLKEPTAYQGMMRRLFMQRIKANIRLNDQTLIDFYLAATIAQCTYPVYHVLFLNSQYQLTHTLEIIQGPVDAIESIAKAIAKQAQHLNSENVIIAHNTQQKTPVANAKDYAFNAAVKNQLAKATIGLYGHYLVGESYVVVVQRAVRV